MAEGDRSGSSGDPDAAHGWLPPEPPGPPAETGLGGQSQPQPGWQPPPPPPGWQPPPPQQGPPAWPQQGYPQVREPGNSEAVAGFVLGVSALALLLISAGLSSVVSLACGIVAIFLGRSGRRKVDRGETRKHRGLAQAGFIMGLIGAPLSLLATVAWTLLFLSDDFQGELERDLDEDQGSLAPALLHVAVVAIRGLAG